MLRKLFTATVCLFAGSLYAQSGPITGATCVSTGTVEVPVTIRITSGTFDGGCKTYIPGSGMDSNSHSETVAARSIIFRLENGARLRNVIISQAPAPRSNTAQAIAIYAGATLENVHLTRGVTDSSISVKTTGTVNMTNITSVGSTDRHIYVAAANTNVVISNCIFKNARKVYRQAVSTTFPYAVRIDRCDISGMTDQIFRVDSVNATASLTNSRLSNNKTICTGYASGNCTVSGNVTY